MGQREYERIVELREAEINEEVSLAEIDRNMQRIVERYLEPPHPYDCHCVECVLDAAIEERIDYA